MPSCPPYLIRSRHGIYYFRLVVPKRLQSSIGRTEIRRSLRTRSKREALISSAQLLIEAQALLDRHPSTELMGRVPTGKAQPSLATPFESVVASQSLKLTEVMDEYSRVQHHSGISKKTIDDKAALIKLLVRVIGDMPVSAVSASEARRFRDVALKLPPLAARKLNQGGGVSIQDLIDASEKKISIATYNNYIKNLSAFFHFAMEQGHVEENVFSRMRIKQSVKVNTFRSPFSSDDLLMILQATSSEVGYKYWLPRLGVLTGARLNELCQLYREDIVMVRGLPCIHFRAAREDQRMKSLHSVRVIPLHSRLIQIGFLDYIDGACDGCRIFPELRYHEKHGYSGQPSKWFSRLRDGLGINDDKGRKDFHSYRHTVANTLKQRGYAESLIGGLLGHATGGVTYERYGKEYKPEALKDVVESIRIEDI